MREWMASAPLAFALDSGDRSVSVLRLRSREGGFHSTYRTKARRLTRLAELAGTVALADRR
jgi:hypothetical protein